MVVRGHTVLLACAATAFALSATACGSTTASSASALGAGCESATTTAKPN